MKEFADDNLNFDKNGRKFPKWIENTVGEGEIALDEQFLLLPQCFQDLYYKHIKTRASLGKGQKAFMLGLCGKGKMSK